jgi:hypothetical protein
MQYATGEELNPCQSEDITHISPFLFLVEEESPYPFCYFFLSKFSLTLYLTIFFTKSSYKIYASWPAKQNSGGHKVVSKTFVDLIQGQIELLRQDLSILGRRCVAFRKISTDQRRSDWYSEF